MGISHLEDLAVSEFIDSIRNISTFQATEKLDGSQLIFGLDEHNKLYTSREGKSGNRFYTPGAYGDAFWTTGFKGAHLTLNQVEKTIKQILKPGDSIEVEVLYGAQPNAVPYRSDINYIIFLRPITGEPDLSKLEELIVGRTFEIILDSVPTTSDGKNITMRKEKQFWKFAQVPAVDSDKVLKLEKNTNIAKKIKKLEAYLKATNSAVPQMNNLEILSVKLNQRPEKIDQDLWKSFKVIIAEQRPEVIQHILDIKLGIKQELLNTLVRAVNSELGPKLEDGGWIEGVVFRDKSSGKQFKLVDKEVFTAINKFNFAVRNEVREEIWLGFKRTVAEILGQPKLFGPGKNTYINSQGGIENIANSSVISQQDKKSILATINEYTKKLTSKLKEYKEQQPKLQAEFNIGDFKQVKKYDDAIHDRTLQDFASIFKRLDSFRNRINSSRSNLDILNTYLEEQSLNEGGNVFPQTKRIALNEIPKTLAFISKVSGLPYDYIRNNVLGSVGKSATSGDIDISVDNHLISIDDFYLALAKRLGSDNTAISRGLEIVHGNVPIQGDPNLGFVQTDFMFTPNTTWAKFNFFSAGDASKYKGALRTKFLASIAAASNKTTYENGELVKREGYVWQPSKGIEYQIRIRPVGKHGERLKGWKVISHGNIIEDPVLVAQFLFNNNVLPEQLGSVESIFALVKKYKTPEEQAKIFDILRKGAAQNNLEVPKDMS